MPIFFNRARLKRRWWQRLLRGGAAGSIFLAVAAVTLPWWLPCKWIARQVETDLSAKLGAAVHVGELAFHWSSGITVTNLTVDQPAGFGAEPLMTAARVRIGFSPLGVLLDGKLNYLSIEQPSVRVVARPDGQVNLLQIHPPTMKLEPRRTSLLAGTVTVLAPNGQTFRLQLADAQIFPQRLNPMGRLKLTGRLEQAGTAAPFFADIAVDGADADVDVGFSDLDLSMLDLASLPHSPLAHLRGTARGRLSVPLHQGAIRGGKLDVQVAGLDIQPASGIALPVLPHARLGIEGDVDLAARTADLRHVTVAAAGVELSGHAAFNGALLEGSWLGVHNLRLAGRADPQALLALMGRDEAAGPLGMTGPVGVELAYERFDQDISARIMVDATEAAVTLGGRVAKPAGTPLACMLKASCNPKTWQFNLDHTELRLGGNRFVGRGAIANIRRLATQWSDPAHAWTLAELWGEVAQLEWSGQAELTELDSVRALHPALRRLLERWRLSGQLAGAWSLNQDGAGDFQSRLAMGPDSQLNVAGAFAKPPGVSMELRIGALLDLHAPFVRAGRAELSCGRGHLELRLTDVTRDGNDPASAAVAHGNFRGDSLEDFVRCLMIAGPPAAQGDDADAPPPAAAAGGNAAAPQAAIPLAGAITGEFVAHVGSDLALLHADADATELALWNAATALKAPGEGAWAALDLRWERPAGLLTGQANLRAEAAEAKLNLQFQREAWSAQLDATLRDAAWLSRRLPLAAAGHKLNLDGTGTLSAHVDGRDGALTATISAEGRDLGIAVDGVPAGKPRGDPLSFSATGRLFEDENGPALQLTTIDLAAGPLALEGTAKVHLAAAPTVQCSGVLKAALGPELGRLSPLLRPVISLLGLSGAMQAGVNVDWAAGQDLRAAVELDATGLAVAPVVVPIRKPAGKPATLKAEVRFHPQLAQVDVDNLQGQLGPIQAQGSSTIFLHPLRCQGRLSARMDDAAPLADFSPLLADLAPAGGFACSSEFTADASTIRVRQLSLQLDNLRGRWQGQEVSIGGAVRVEDAALALLPHPQPAVGAVRTDNLHIRAAEQDLTLVLDLHDLLAGPKGQITLLADRIDSARLDALKPHQNLPAKVDEAYRQRLMRQVSAIIAQVAERLRGCDLHIRADIAQVHDWLDPRTDHRCDVQELSVRGSIVDGRIDATIASGVNGGTFLAQVQTDLREPSPQLTFTNQIRDMTSTDALNAQVAELFPDNHVLGTLWREMTLHMPVEQAAAELVDPRVKSHPVGSGVAHMNRGVVSGRAAPRFVTAVFPGLNLVAYSYDQMVAFSDYHADGSAANDMVFSAPDYDMYIEGLTGADHIGHYEIGLILLGSQQSPEWNHRFRQGRVPVLRFSAGLVHGHKVNEEISYLWPNQSAFSMFLKNNYFYRLWLERQKRGQATNGKPESR